jgi:hypothetical protein
MRFTNFLEYLKNLVRHLITGPQKQVAAIPVRSEEPRKRNRYR